MGGEPPGREGDLCPYGGLHAGQGPGGAAPSCVQHTALVNLCVYMCVHVCVCKCVCVW